MLCSNILLSSYHRKDIMNMISSQMITLLILAAMVCSSSGHSQLRRLSPWCDPLECYPGTSQSTCHVLGMERAVCGCSYDMECTQPEVCTHDPIDCVRDSITGRLECAKQCGCVLCTEIDGMSIGCGEDKPFCLMGLGGPYCQECRGDYDCVGGETCGQPSCVADLPNTCDTDHDATWDCDSLDE